MQLFGYAGARERSKKSEPLRMTALLGGLKQLVGYAGARERSKKSEPLRMTALFGGLQCSWLDTQEDEKDLKNQSHSG
jgi:hypothetical protein